MPGDSVHVSQCCENKKINIQRLRQIVRKYIDKHLYDSASFWADKLVSLSGGAVEDIYWYAQTLYLTGQYHRAVNLLCGRRLDKFQCGELQEALNVLEMADGSMSRLSLQHTGAVQPTADIDSSLPVDGTDNCISLLRGKVYASMDNRALAADCFRQALQQDVYCFEAFQLLSSNHMLSSQKEKQLIDSLPLAMQCPEEEIELVKFLYENRLKKYDQPGRCLVPDKFPELVENMEVVVNCAERLYYNCHFQQCFQITSRILCKDPYNIPCLPLHIAVLVELKKANDLFYLAHKLVEFYPNKPVSWLAVGCYYLLNKNSEPARRYLSKATTLEKCYGPAWLAYGHSFAADCEHDQAMAAYFTASQIMQGCHLPVLYIGLEYGLTSNMKLAERFFGLARSISPHDPFVFHEMGVIAFQNHDFEEAEKLFLEAVNEINAAGGSEQMPEKWEPLVTNLAHVSRKLQKYDVALDYHHQALLLSPQNSSTYSSIAYVHALMGENSMAVDFFHKALGLRHDDAFSTTMLCNIIDVLMNELPPVVDDVGDQQVADKSRNAFTGLLLDRHLSSFELTNRPLCHESSSMTALEDTDMVS